MSTTIDLRSESHLHSTRFDVCPAVREVLVHPDERFGITVDFLYSRRGNVVITHSLQKLMERAHVFLLGHEPHREYSSIESNDAV